MWRLQLLTATMDTPQHCYSSGEGGVGGLEVVKKGVYGGRLFAERMQELGHNQMFKSAFD
jgi:hypothetical protein